MTRQVVDRYEIITDVDEALDRLKAEGQLGFDIETGGLNPWRDPIATIQLFGPRTKTAALLHLRGHMPERLRRFLGSGRLLIGHNVAMFDAQFLAQAGVDIYKAEWFDTLIAETVISPGGRKNVRHDLGTVMKRRLNKGLNKSIDHGSWMNETLTPEQVEYAMYDVLYLPRLMEEQQRQAHKLGSEEALRLEMAILPAVIRMRDRGMPIDLQSLDSYLESQEVLAQKLQAQVAQATRCEGLNINSPKQVMEALANIGIRVKATKKELLEKVVLTLAARNAPQEVIQAVQAIIDYRAAAQRLSYYGGDFASKFVIDGWIHASYRPCGAATGRFTSSGPNMQQIPKDMRWVFRAPPGFKIVTADYSAIEVWAAAYIAQDERLIQALQEEDFHSHVASLVFGVPVDQVDKTQRQLAKSMSFRLFFGGGVKAFHEEAAIHRPGTTRQEAAEMFQNFFQQFPKTWRMREEAVHISRTEQSYWLTMPNGLKRLLTGYELTSTRLLNNIVQGTAGVGLKYALEETVRRGLAQYFGTTVHDELVMIVPEHLAQEVADELVDCMLVGMRRAIPATVKVHYDIEDTWVK